MVGAFYAIFPICRITGDGLSANIATAEILGVKLQTPHNIQAWFPHPCNPFVKVWFIFDPCHMLKLMRNMLASWKVLLDGETNSCGKSQSSSVAFY